MNLMHFHAYQVWPTKWNEPPNIAGGRVAIDSNISGIIENNITKAKFDQCLESVFDMDNDRHNEMRTLIMQHAFGNEADADDAAKEVAAKLCDVMDNRSSATLLVIASQQKDLNAHTTLWAFPREEALRLINQSTSSNLQVLTDIFSQSSRLKKAASFKGMQAKTEFIGGNILDFQASGGAKAVAEFWIRDFLQSSPAIKPKPGTKMIAKALIECARECKDLLDQQQLQNAAMGLRSGPKTVWSPTEIAKQFFSENLTVRFRKKFPNDASYVTAIELDQVTYEQNLNFSVFTLDSGVIISSPFAEIGDTVKLREGAKGTHLSCEGTVVSQKVRSPNGVR